MTAPDEMRITDAEVAVCPRESVVCPSCHGLGVYEGRGVVDDVPCSRCNGGGEVRGDRIVLDGASARIGAAIVAHLPHLRHAADIVDTDGEYELLRTAVGRWGVRTVGVDDAAWADSEAEARIVYASCPRHPEWPS